MMMQAQQQLYRNKTMKQLQFFFALLVLLSVAAPRVMAAENDFAFITRADSAIQLIKKNDWKALAALVHPTTGLKFSPYASVEEGALVFSPDKVKLLGTDKKTYEWGAWDGSGEPMNLTFAEYYARFVYDKDYANKPEIGINKIIRSGNTADGIAEAFGKDAAFVEYHKAASQKDGMDWGSLRLVFKMLDGKWYLVGIVHDGWTT
jgi:hypothetical protein